MEYELTMEHSGLSGEKKDKSGMIKLLVFDLDGTLLDNGELSADSIEGLIAVQRKGIKIMLATGRNISDALEFERALKIRDYGGIVAYSDGQYVIDYQDGSFVEQDFLEFPDDVKKVMELASAAEPIALFGREADYRVFFSRFSVKYIKALLRSMLISNSNNLLLINGKERVERIDKMGVILCDAKIDIDWLKKQYEVVYDCNKNRYEIKHKGVNKGSAIRIIQNKYGFSEQSIAVFGNDENDISMFERYSLSYAVETAPEYVKTKAKRRIKVLDGKPNIMEEVENLLKER